MSELLHLHPAKIAVVKFFGSSFDMLNNPSDLVKATQGVVDQMGWNNRQVLVEQFKDESTGDPLGLTLAEVLAESALVIHTWPEYFFGRANIELCAPEANFVGLPEAVLKHYQARAVLVETFEDDGILTNLTGRFLIDSIKQTTKPFKRKDFFPTLQRVGIEPIPNFNISPAHTIAVKELEPAYP